MMTPEGRKKEAANAVLIQKLMASVRHLPPRDAGDGWVEAVLPNHEIFKDCHNYQKPIPPGFLIVMVQKRRPERDEGFPNGRWHLSMSHNMMFRQPGASMNAPGRLPTWKELKEARYKFLSPEVNMALMFPPMRLYYSFHETCLHMIQIPLTETGANGKLISPEQLPNWNEIKKYRYEHFSPEANMAFLFPPNEKEAALNLVEIPVHYALDPDQQGGI